MATRERLIDGPLVSVERLQAKIRTWQRRTAKAEAPLQAYVVGRGISRELYTMDCLTSPNGETTRRRWPAGPSSLLQGMNTQQQRRPAWLRRPAAHRLLQSCRQHILSVLEASSAGDTHHVFAEMPR
jgi:hypothetical protein